MTKKEQFPTEWGLYEYTQQNGREAGASQAEPQLQELGENQNRSRALARRGVMKAHSTYSLRKAASGSARVARRAGK